MIDYNIEMSRRDTIKELNNRFEPIYVLGRVYRQFYRLEIRDYLREHWFPRKPKGLAACERKVDHTYNSAEIRIFKAKLEGVELRKYVCIHCGNYHLTSQSVAFD